VLTRTLSQGNSQSGRYLRDFIYSGFNEDGAHRVVFDGSIPPVGEREFAAREKHEAVIGPLRRAMRNWRSGLSNARRRR
jgi:hypothetical protein